MLYFHVDMCHTKKEKYDNELACQRINVRGNEPGRRKPRTPIARWMENIEDVTRRQ